jgi:hypothetical protein
MKKTKLVTALYSDIGGPPFFGHLEQAREDRYFHSLRTIANTKEEIILYCNETQYEKISNYISEYELDNVTLKISNLIDYPNSKKMIQIKEETGDYKMYHEIDWNKIYLLEKEYDESYDYIYWIDVGLAHPGLFLDRYNPYSEKADGMSRTWENYSYINLFDNNLISKMNEFTGDKLLNLSTTQFFHNMIFAKNILDKEFNDRHITIGGILGGHVSKLKWFFYEFKKMADKTLDKNVLLNHEAMISFLNNENPEMFETFVFDTWYHNDYWKKTPQFDTDSIKNRVHFVHFFEKKLKI